MPKWTDRQQSVIDSRDKNILVSAAAGSGKTAVLVERIIQRILDEDNPLDIDRLLVVTFTNAAATEMRERILNAIETELAKAPDNQHLQRQQTYIHNASITTIHSFCLNVVKEHFNEVDLDPSVKVADEGEMSLLKSDVVKEVLEEYYAEGSEKFYGFVEQFEGKNSDDYLEEMILKLYNKAVGYPWPFEWLDNLMIPYNYTTEDELLNSEYINLINTYADGMLNEAVESYKLMTDICNSGGPAVYTDTLLSECESIQEIINEKNYAKRKVKLQFTFENLPKCKKDECDIQLKECVIGYRNEVKKIIKKLKEKLYFQDISVTLEELQKCRPIIQMYVNITKSFMTAFKEKKKDRNVIDFNDFEHYAIEILTKRENGRIVPTDVAIEMAAGFDEVMVDEYQDSNSIQETILYSVSKNRDGIYNRFMVGDMKQSIYGFRGANPDIFIDKYNTYTTDGSNPSAYKIILDKNFRSRSEVIQSVNFIFSQIMNEDFGRVNYDDENRLYCGAEYKKKDELSGRIGGKTELLLINSGGNIENDMEIEEYRGESFDEESEETDDIKENANELEAKVIAGRIKQLVDTETGMMVYDKELEDYRTARYSDIVVLVRSITGIGEIISDELMKSGIPGSIASKSGYFKTLEISTIISYLKIIDNPMQDIPLAAVLKSPMVGISDEELANIRVCGDKENSLYENVLEFVSQNEDERLDRFLELLDEFRFKVTYMSIYDLLTEVLSKTDYYNFVKAMPSGNQRKANIDMLKEKAAAYEKSSYKGLFNFIRYIEKLKKYEVDMGEASILSEADNVVRIMTIHKSKGLEFPIVFVANMNKQFNLMDAKSKISMHFNMGVGMDYIDTDTRIKSKNLIKTAINTQISLETIEEEMRLFYVACTRAKEKLIFTAGGIDETKLKKMTSQRFNTHGFLGYGVLAGCKSMLDFVALPVGRNKAFKDICEEYIGETYMGEGKLYNLDSNILVKYINVLNVFKDIVKNKVNMKMNVDRLIGLPTDIIYDSRIYELLSDKINYVYEYQAETETNAKVSVSEIKKITYETDIEEAELWDIAVLQPQNIDEENSAASDIKSNVESDRESNSESNSDSGVETESYLGYYSETNKQGNMSGAAKGTAYHTVFELFDFDIEPTEDNLTAMLDKIESMGKLSKEERSCIDVNKLIKFANSSLGRRMKNAYKSGELYREAQFVMGIPKEMVEEFKHIAKEVAENKVFIEPDMSKQNGDIILIQGIIDVYFIEDGKVVIADYKTDNVWKTEDLKNHYYVQLELYKQAVEQITGMKVSEKILYSVKLSQEIKW